MLCIQLVETLLRRRPNLDQMRSSSGMANLALGEVNGALSSDCIHQWL